MPIILLTKREAKAIAKEFKRNKIGGTFSIKPFDDQVYKTKQTGVYLVHQSYKVNDAQLKFICARARRPMGVLVKSARYGNRRAFPEPRPDQTNAYKDLMSEEYDDLGHKGVANYIMRTLRTRNDAKNVIDIKAALKKLARENPNFDPNDIEIRSIWKRNSFRA